MNGRAIGILVCVAILDAAGLWAQTDAPVPDQTAVQTAGSSAIDPTKLGVSLDRLRIQLAQPETPTGTKGLRIRETVEVVGTAPPLLLWDPKTARRELTSQAVPWGA